MCISTSLYRKLKLLFSLIIIYGSYNLMGQDLKPDSNKNPVKAMFYQRYLHVSDIIPTLNYKFKTLKYHRKIENLKNYKKDWVLTFEDDFDSLNTTKWRLGQPWGYFHDISLHQYYESNNVKVKDGLLYLQGLYAPKQFKYKDSMISIPYSIGLINSDISFSQKYGYFEIRCKNPHGPATWTAFWLAGAHRWPPEIDIFEMYGKRSTGTIHTRTSSIHFGVSGTKSRASFVRSIKMPKDTDTSFHIYGCQWNERFINFYNDGILVRKQRVNKKLKAFMDDEMVVIINNSFEAKYLKYLPKPFTGNSFVIDWVRVYKKK